MTKTLAVLLLLSISSMSPADDFAADWKTFSPDSKVAYVHGLLAGMYQAHNIWSDCAADAADDTDFDCTDLTADLHDRLIVRIDPEVIVKQIDELYADSANSFIHYGSIVLVAIQRIKGTEVEKTLRTLRASAAPE